MSQWHGFVAVALCLLGLFVRDACLANAEDTCVGIGCFEQFLCQPPLLTYDIVMQGAFSPPGTSLRPLETRYASPLPAIHKGDSTYSSSIFM